MRANRRKSTRFPSWGAFVLLLLSSGAAGGSLEDSAAAGIRSSLFFSDAGLAVKAIDKEPDWLLASRPDLVLSICVFAADSAFQLRPGLKGDEPRVLADRLEAFAAGARSSPAARWAKAEVRVLRARLGLRFETGTPQELLDAAAEVVRATEGTDLAEQGLLRAVDLHLEAAARTEGRAKAIEGLASLAGHAESDESISKAARAAARAAVLLEGDGDVRTRVEGGLALLAPFTKLEVLEPCVVRRRNDFVTLGRTIGRKDEYCLVPLEAHGGQLSFRAPLSRCWRVLQPDPRDGHRVAFFLLRSDGAPRFEIDTAAYLPGQKYPPDAAKQADGRQTRKVAEAYLAADKVRFVVQHTRGVQKAKLGAKVKEACGYELLAGGALRVRAWFFQGEKWSYGLRIVEQGPGFEPDDPELDAMLLTFDAK